MTLWLAARAVPESTRALRKCSGNGGFGAVVTGNYRSPMKRSFLLQNFILAGALILSSCAQDHAVPFDAAAFARHSGTGTGIVTGTASLTNAYNRVVTAGDSSATIQLMPVNAYTDEIVEKSYKVIGRMSTSDPRFSKFVRETKPDDAGHFTFTHVPPGSYYVSSELSCTDPSTPDNTPLDRWIFKKISVANGQTVRVERWDETQ
jgi:hypothetical protein